MKMKKVISLVLSAAMAASLCGCLGGSNAATTAAESSAAGSTAAAGEETTAAAAETKEHSADAVGLKLSTTIKELELTTVPNGMGVQAMADYLDEQDGGVYLDMYLDGVLGSSTDELLGGAQTGAFDMVALSFGNWGDYTDGFAALSIPYLFTSSEQVYAYIDGPEGDAMKQQVEEDTGMVVLAFLDVGFRNITNSRGPIKTPDDVKGLKLRTQNDRYQIAALEALGATCSVISFSELYSSLQQGLVVFVCLGNLDSTIAARIVDFVGGAVYLLHASIQLMNEDTLLLTPESVSITTDPLAPSDAFPQWRAKL